MNPYNYQSQERMKDHFARLAQEAIVSMQRRCDDHLSYQGDCEACQEKSNQISTLIFMHGEMSSAEEELTVDHLRNMPAQSIFASGVICDNAEGCNMTNSGRYLRWVAVKGDGSTDWAIYVHWTGEHNDEWIARNGQKVLSFCNIEGMVKCTLEAREKYRR